MKFEIKHFNNYSLFFVFLLCNILLFTISCEKEVHNSGYINELLGRWKCVGFGNSENGIYRNIEPHDCADCYEFSFRTDSLFIGKTYLNGMNWHYKISAGSIKFTDCLTTLVYEQYDTEEFINAVYNSYSYQLIDSTKLRLYYAGDTFNYLLFIKCEPYIRM